MVQCRPLRFVLVGLVAGLELLMPAGMVAQDAAAKPPAPFLRELTGERRPKVPGLDSLPMFESEYGWLLFSREYAEPAAEAIREAATKFRTMVGQPVPRGLLYPNRGPGAKIDVKALQKALGAEWVGFLDTVPFRRNPAAFLRFVTHEASHAWYRGAYGPKSPWLQESSAQLMEAPDAKQQDADSLIGWYRKEMLYPFKTLLTMPNPVNGNSMGWPTRTAMSVFYMQAESLLRFLLEQGKDPALLPAILAQDSRGAPFAEWLQANGKRYNLPTTIDELEAAWKASIAQQAARKP